MTKMSSAGKAILWGGFWCGVLDFLSAYLSYMSAGATPIRIGQSIAAGLLGRTAALQGGWRTGLLGIFLHFVIAFGAAIVFYVASRSVRFLTDHPVIAGLIYGELVFLFMNMVVLPLSAIHRNPLQWTSFSPWQALVTGSAGHPFLVGLPIAIATARYAPHARVKLEVKRAAG
jgi:hypothetical protein